MGAATIRVFISHSSHDVGLAKPVVDLLRFALNLPAEEIRCTTVPGHKLPGGARTSQQLRQELLDAPVFIGLITEASIASLYVLVEMGARWGTEKQLIPLLGPGVSVEVLQGPLSDLNALSCSSQADLHSLVSQVGEALGVPPGNPASYLDALEMVTAAYPSAAVARRVPQSAVDELAELRSEGIHEILNRPVKTDKDVAKLTDFTRKWSKRAMRVLEQNFSKAEQLNFSRLGAVPNVIFPH